jgi:ubiquinone/menaquinone biosynthesis C-methylase UbiE
MRLFSKLLTVLSCLWLLFLAPSYALIDSRFYSYRSPSSNGIGKVYMGREISQVMGHQGADWLDRFDRQKEEQPQKLVDTLNLQPDDVVGDIGAGTGYISKLLAAQVPAGQVLAVDIQPEMIAILNKRFSKTTNIKAVLSQEQKSGLTAASIDLALMVDVYHEFNYPREMMADLVTALKPNGQIILAEYRGEDPFVFIKPHHKTTQRQIQREMAAVGLKLNKNLDVLPQQHLMFFSKSNALVDNQPN